MTIKNIKVVSTGMAGVKPKFIYIETDNTKVEVKVPGFLNSVVADGYPISEYDAALVSTKPTPGSRKVEVGLYGISREPNGGVNAGATWSLVTPAGSDSVNEVRETVVTTSGTYTAPTNLVSLRVQMVGGGGGGGGTDGNSSTVAGGGGAGGYAEAVLSKDDVGPSRPYVVGSGGTGGLPNSGGSPGTGSSFGVNILTAGGGLGGLTGATFGGGGLGGSAGGVASPKIVATGNHGRHGNTYKNSSDVAFYEGGGNGDSFFGGFVNGGHIAAGQRENGLPGNAYGAGGAGGASEGVALLSEGGAGIAGVIIFTEYLS